MNFGFNVFRKYKTAFAVGALASCGYQWKYNAQHSKISESIFALKYQNLMNFQTKWYAQEQFARKNYSPDLKTDVYVWGNGIVINNEMDYSNYFPNKIVHFSSETSPTIISVKFGLYHEAYLDTEGRIHICDKHKLPSKRVSGQDDGMRYNFHTLQVEGEQIVEINFTKNRLFGLTASGKVYIWIITKEEPLMDYDSSNIDQMFERGPLKDQVVSNIEPEAYLIDELRNIVSIKTGEDHFLALDEEGVAWAMGDDKYGQCGQFQDGRPVIAPFREARIGRPQKVNWQEKIVKVEWGQRHSFAITDNGRLYAWGFNHQVQISHGDNMASAQSHKQVIFEPITITKEIDSHRVTHVSGGSDFSIIISENGRGEQHFWGSGNNLRGQIGNNMTTHYHDMSPMHFEDEPIEPVKFEFLSWGRRHSIIALEKGGLFIWGDNEYGQLGNKKRRVSAKPLLRPRFSNGVKIIDVECSGDNSAVIVERPKQKKKKRKTKEVNSEKKSIETTDIIEDETTAPENVDLLPNSNINESETASEPTEYSEDSVKDV